MKKEYFIIADFICWDLKQAKAIQRNLIEQIGLYEPIYATFCKPNIAKGI